MSFFNIFSYFPSNIKNLMDVYFKNNDSKAYIALEEIRLRANKPLILKFNTKEVILEYIVTQEDILQTLGAICENSIYSYQNQICNGYITIKGGHRVGIAGNVVFDKGKIININHISSLNFRVSKQLKGCSNKILKFVLDVENNTIYNTLIVSPPGARKNHYFKRFN